MPRQPKPRPVGRPKLPRGEARAAALQVRLSPEERKRFESAAKASQQTITEWVRSTLNASFQV